MIEENDENTLLSRQVLAVAYTDNYQLKEAIEILTSIETIRAKVLAEDDEMLLAIRHQLAMACSRNKQAAEAFDILTDVVTIKAKSFKFAEKHPIDWNQSTNLR